MLHIKNSLMFYKLYDNLKLLSSSAPAAETEELTVNPITADRAKELSRLSAITPDEIVEPSGSHSPWFNIFDMLHATMDAVKDLQEQVKTLKSSSLAPYEIHDLGTLDLELKHPLKVLIDVDENGDYLALFPDAHLYGAGETIREAVDDLKEEIVYLFNDYNKPDQKLGPQPKRIKRLLNRLIVKVG